MPASHCVVCDDTPGHAAPLYWGVGREQVLCLDHVPSSQVTEHPAHGAHVPQAPSTVELVYRLFKIIKLILQFKKNTAT